MAKLARNLILSTRRLASLVQPHTTTTREDVGILEIYAKILVQALLCLCARYKTRASEPRGYGKASRRFETIITRHPPQPRKRRARKGEGSARD